jgi:hypothetical protein
MRIGTLILKGTVALALGLMAAPERMALAAKPADHMTVGGGLGSAAPSGVEKTSAVQAISNVMICGAAYDQFAPIAIQDGDGGTLTAWGDYRSGGLDVYVQRLDEGGNPVWPVDGVPGCKAPGSQGNPQIISDGAGGLIAVWQDERYGAADIYAQRLNASGVPMWSPGGVRICHAVNPQRDPVVVSDGLSGAIVAWVDERAADADVYAQRLNAGGTPQWAEDGVALCTAAGNQEGLSAISDGQGGALVVWSDSRGGFGQSDLYARRVDAAGTPLWAADGVALCSAAGLQESADLVSDGARGMIVAWADRRGAGSDVYVQRMNSAGNAQWTADGVLLCGAAGDQQRPQICSDGANGALVVWEDRRGAAADVYARRVNASGAPQWAADGVGLCTASADQLTPSITTDPVGGAVVAWSDARTPANGQDIYLQHVQPDGTVLWTVNGVLVCDTAGNQTLPVVAVDGLGGATAVWRDFRSGLDWDLYSQRVNSSGQVPSQCTGTIVLAPGAVTTTTSGVHFYSWYQEMFYWSAVGVRPSAGTDWDIEVYEPYSFGLSAYPVCFGNSYAGSFGGSGVDFVVGNFNTGRTPILQELGVRASRYSGGSTAQVEWDNADDILVKEGSGGQTGAKSPNGWTGVIDVWDLFLFAGQTYTFDFTRTGTADIKLLFFHAPGTIGSYIAPRSARVFETTSRYTLYQAPSTGWYGVIMVNDNGASGTYTTKVSPGILTGVGDAPHAATGIHGLAPNPSRGDVLIQFALAGAGEVSFEMLDMAGRRVGSVAPRRWEAGTWNLRWNGSGTDGRLLSPGVYFVQMKVDGKTIGQSRLALIR